MQKSIGVVTSFYAWNTSYSLTSVIGDQLVANLKYGYKTILFTLPSFNDDASIPEGVEIRKIIPAVILEPYKGLQVSKDYYEDKEKVIKALVDNAQDIDVFIAHDLHFIDTYLPYCAAIHEICEKKLLKGKWLLWTHSAPSSRITEGPHSLRYKLPMGAKLVYLNHYHALKLAESYGTWLSEVRIVPNTVDPRTFWNFHPLTKSLIDKYDLLSADIMGVYPLSSTRMVDGKQVHKAVKIMAKLKALGNNVKYVVCNAHANAVKEKMVIQDLQKTFMDWGLSSSEVIFTSLEGKHPIDYPNDPNCPACQHEKQVINSTTTTERWDSHTCNKKFMYSKEENYEQGVPRQVISELFQLSNLFLFPSISENCSLILLEAMLAKNLLVLNNDAPMMREFGKENALYFDFAGLGVDRKYDNEDAYYNDIAKIIMNQLQNNKPLLAQREVLKTKNYDYIFRKFIEPLYYE